MPEEFDMINGHYPFCNHRHTERFHCRVCDREDSKRNPPRYMYPILRFGDIITGSYIYSGASASGSAITHYIIHDNAT
jgi:hypothetical protein